MEKRKMHLKNLNLVNTAISFCICSQETIVQNEQLRIRRQRAPNRFSKTGKGEIEGTIMLLSSRERNENKTQKTKTYSKLWFLLYIYSVTPRLRQGGREDWGKVSSIPVSRSSWQGKTWRKTKLGIKKEKQSEQPSLSPLFYCSTLFLVYPLSPHSFGESPGFELFFFLFNL